MPRYIYNHLRPGHGYMPGDEVSKEFAEGHIALVREVPETEAAAPGNAAHIPAREEAVEESE